MNEEQKKKTRKKPLGDKYLDLEGAANRFGYSKEFIRLQAKAGRIRGLKCGVWLFAIEDLDRWFDAMASGGIDKRENEECLSVNIKKVVSGTLTLGTKDSAYIKALGLPTKKPLSDITIR